VILQMIEDSPTTEAPRRADGARFIQCRLPAAHYEWLRYRAFVDRCSMNSILLEAVTALQEASPDVTVSLPLTAAPTTAGSVKFNVHLAGFLYEWLRTKAFNSRGSINQVLIQALVECRAGEDRSFKRSTSMDARGSAKQSRP
jgi:hypothetical protein